MVPTRWRKTRVGKEEDILMSSAEENMALARRFLEARGRADLDALEHMMAPDFVDHTLTPSQQLDRESYKRSVAEYVSAFSDIRILIEDQIAAGDKVVTRFIGHLTHDRRELMGVAPTGMELTNRVIVIHRISGGKIAEEWGVGTSISEVREGAMARLVHQAQERLERERVEHELRVARRIQQASLPKEVPELAGWQIAYHYQPAREVGGDFYDFHLLSEGRLGMVMGDATGKGVPAALVMSTTCGMLQLAAGALGSPSPAKVLEQVNEVLLARIPDNMFVTCFYCILDPKSGHLSYANAGHNLPCRRHDGQADELRARGMPLGLMPGMAYEEKEAMLETGDSVLFYSDGLVEAHDPQRREMFGFPRLRELVGRHGEEGVPVDFLMEELYSFVGENWEQEDDITLLTLQRSASLS
jgi:serine phosphatase RsbU (regulator of sigma subunit)/predicted ester cyclase